MSPQTRHHLISVVIDRVSRFAVVLHRHVKSRQA
jgi:hypothetical protein